MKNLKLLLLALAFSVLTACGPIPAPIDPTQTATQAVAPAQGGMSPVTSGLLGAAAGYMMGRSTSPRVVAAPAPVVVHRTVVVNRPVYVPPPAVSTSPRSYSNSISSRGGVSFRGRR